MNLQKIVDDEVPMLDEVLGSIGIHQTGQPMDLARLLNPFSTWLEQQAVGPQDEGFVGALVGAFVAQYAMRHGGASRSIADGEIFLEFPAGDGIVRRFSPYRMASAVVRRTTTLVELVDAIIAADR